MVNSMSLLSPPVPPKGLSICPSKGQLSPRPHQGPTLECHAVSTPGEIDLIQLVSSSGSFTLSNRIKQFAGTKQKKQDI